jgi:TatD DNase family protein
MKFTDTHCHLYTEEFDKDRAAMLKRAENENVEKFYLPAIDSESTDALLNLEAQYPGQCFAMMGLHPCYVKENYEEELLNVETWLDKRPFAAIGEIGLDFYWDTSFNSQQYHAFKTQIQWALQYQLPIVIHSRNATDECIAVVKEFASSSLKGIFHCFGGTVEQASQIIEMGFYLGIAEVVQQLPLTALVLETDAPYLSPVPHRGKRNESSYLPLVAAKIAAVKNITIEEVAAVTTANAEKIFRT